MKLQNQAFLEYVTPTETERRSTYLIKPASSVVHSLCYHITLCILFAQSLYDAIDINFEHISYLSLVFLLLHLKVE